MKFKERQEVSVKSYDYLLNFNADKYVLKHAHKVGVITKMPTTRFEGYIVKFPSGDTASFYGHMLDTVKESQSVEKNKVSVNNNDFKRNDPVVIAYEGELRSMIMASQKQYEYAGEHGVISHVYDDGNLCEVTFQNGEQIDYPTLCVKHLPVNWTSDAYIAAAFIDPNQSRVTTNIIAFPKTMRLTNDKTEPYALWKEAEVLGYCDRLKYPWLTRDVIGTEEHYVGYKYAKELDPAIEDAIKLLENNGYSVNAK